MYSKLNSFLDSKDKVKFKFILFLNSLFFFLEFLSLVSIPIFVALLLNPDFLSNKLDTYLSSDFVSILNNKNIIFFSGLFVVSIFFIKNVFLLYLIYIQGKFFKKIKIHFANKLFNYYVNSPYFFHLKNNPSELSRNASGEIQGMYTYFYHFISFIRESIAILVIFTLLMIVNPLETLLICLVLGLIMFAYLKTIKPYIKKKAIKNQELAANITQTIYEAFGAIKDLKILGKEKEIQKYFDKSVTFFEKNLYFFSFFEKIPRIFLELFSIILIITISLTYLAFNQNFVSLLPILSLIIVSIVRFIPAFGGITTSITYMKMFEPSINLLSKEIKKINLNGNLESTFRNTINKIRNLNIKKSYFLVDNVSFKYPESKLVTLKNISMNIERGCKVGITGKTGAGKSTLFYLMLGLFEPKHGNIFYKGLNIFENLTEWRKEIGYVSQNIYLLDSSIKRNIAFNFLDEPIDEKKIEKAINIANLEGKIIELPNGINTNVGTDGLKLSGGERQRIALARAVYREPNIFFMDESTSALDDKTEETIMNNIKTNFNEKTIIIIAHRKTTIDKCDKIWNLKNGFIDQ